VRFTLDYRPNLVLEARPTARWVDPGLRRAEAAAS